MAKFVIKKPQSQQQLNAVGAYIFAGLFTIGVRKHFNVLAHLEDGPFGVDTARANFPNTEIHTDPATWPVDSLQKKRIDFVYANPPCAPWSNANGKEGNSWRTDPRVSCVARTFELLRKLRPRVWTFESVRGVYSRGREMLDDMAAQALELGYSVTHLLTDANNHGVAQIRKRYFMVCHDVEIEFDAPKIKSVTVKDALRDVDPGDEFNKIRSDHLHIAEVTKQGESFRSAFDRTQLNIEYTDRGYVKGRPSYLMVRLDPNKPCPVLTGSATKIHPTEHRFISIEESKAICSVPKDFKLQGSMTSKYAQVAKAVMPRVGEYIAACAARAIKKNFKVKTPSVRQVTVLSHSVEEVQQPNPSRCVVQSKKRIIRRKP